MHMQINGREIPIIITKKFGAKNIILRPKPDAIYLTVPFMISESRALKFVNEKSKWIEKFYAKIPDKKIIGQGDIITLFGTDYVIGRDIIVGGSPEFFKRRLTDIIKKMLMEKIREIVKTAPPELKPKRITLRDTTTRWGSCSTTGTVCFSWRLAFAPLSVLQYVVMHELAHRVHMNHSPEFWALVGELYGNGVGRAKLWLKQHGHELHQF